MASYRFDARLWRYQGKAAWYFLTLPHDVADEIDESTAADRRGFGSVKVEVRVGSSTWSTSIFPDSKLASFVLPVKRAIRTAESIDDGDRVTVHLTVLAASG